jgi:hypothetical protein
MFGTFVFISTRTRSTVSLELTSQHATLLTIVNIVYFYMYVYSFLGRTWGIDWLTCHKSMKYTTHENINVFISTDRSSFPNNKISIFTGRPLISSIFNSISMLFLSKLNLLQYNRKCSEHSFLYPHEQEALTELVPPTVGDTNDYNLRNRLNISQPSYRLSTYQQSYFPSTIKSWNTLDLNYF